MGFGALLGPRLRLGPRLGATRIARRSSATTLIELCEQELRANAKRFDDELIFPRRNLELLGEHGFLGLTVPEEHGGLGEDHVAYSMVCETIARYGCASTAMCYVMHIGAVNAIMLRATPELVDKYIRRLNSGKIGTLSYSDPETGSHFWYPISSAAERDERRLHGAQERVVDDLGGLRRLLRGPDDQPRLLRATTTCRSSSSTATRSSPSPRSGTPSACAATSPGPLEVADVELPEQIVGPRATARSPTTSPSTPGS